MGQPFCDEQSEQHGQCAQHRPQHTTGGPPRAGQRIGGAQHQRVGGGTKGSGASGAGVAGGWEATGDRQGVGIAVIVGRVAVGRKVRGGDDHCQAYDQGEREDGDENQSAPPTIDPRLVAFDDQDASRTPSAVTIAPTPTITRVDQAARRKAPSMTP